MKNFLKAFLSFGLATSIEKMLGFILLPVYTRYFSLMEYGVIDMIAVTVSVVVIFGVCQMETSLQRYYYQYSGLRKSMLVTNVYFWTTIFSLILCIFLFFFSDILAILLLKDVSYSYLLKIASPQILFININMLGLVVLRFEKENIKFLLVILIKVLSSLFFSLYFVIVLKWGLLGVIFGQTLSLFISSLYVTIYVRKSFIMNFSRIVTRRIFNYSFPSFPARIGSILIVQLNRFFMLGFLSLSAIGLYSVSLKLASAIQIANTAFIMAWTPLMVKLFQHKKNKEIFPKILSGVSSAIFLIVSVITLLSKEIFVLTTTEDYFEGSRFLGGLAFYFALYIIKEVVDIGPRITEKTKYLTINFVLSLIVNAITLYFLILYMELEGVVISMIITNLFLVGISWYTSNRLYYMKYSYGSFFLLLLPCLTLVLISLFFEIELAIRLMLLIFIVIYYGINLFRKRDSLSLVKY